MRDRWQRTTYGPMRHKTKTGVPADHFAPMGRYGDGRRALLADGPAVLDKPLLLPLLLVAAGVQLVKGSDGSLLAAAFAEADVDQMHICELPGDWPLDKAWTCQVCSEEWPPIEAAMARHPAAGLRSGAEPEPGLEERIAAAAASAVARPERRAASSLSQLPEQMRREHDAENEITDEAEVAALVASAFEGLGGIDALNASRARRGLVAAIDSEGNVTPGNWHGYVCAEGIRTDDHRELAAGSVRYPDLPVSLRLLVEDEGGHWGAVTCGRIDALESANVAGVTLHRGEGAFGSDPNGQLAELLVEEQTQRFLSVDLRDMTGEYVEVEITVAQDGVVAECESDYDWWYRVSDCVVGASTIVAMAAYQMCVIAPAGMALPESPTAMATAPPNLEDIAEAIAASAGAPDGGPPSRYFDNPGFHVGDARLVKQPDGHYACPVTISEPDENGWRHVVGHVAYWGAQHTGFRQKMNPPRSKSGYAHYLTGACPCDDPECEHAIGQVTMGTGHAPLERRNGAGKVVGLAAHEVKAHYDGGYGAKQITWNTAGEDDFGIWFSGAIRPDVTDDELRDFMAMGVSGDWREMAGALDLLAVLSVPVPGFPIARRALAASGAPLADEAPRFAFIGDRVHALVAAGVVRRVPDGERIASLEQQVDELSAALRPLVLASLRASLA